MVSRHQTGPMGWRSQHGATYAVCAAALLLLGGVLTPCAYAQGITPVVDRSRLKFADPAMAHAEVRKLVLANGMRVYLLHDPTAQTDAVACAVRAGGWQDPVDAPGMAHFVEHLLFMGSKEYPGEDDFYAFLARHGGNTNAYTTVDRTVFMFDVESEALPNGLKRFGAFFKHPLLRDASIVRERLAVDQEFRAKQRLDGWRESMVDAAVSNAAHPNRHFHIGTQQTLAQVDHERMVLWFEQHYSAHLMDVVVRGSQSLDVLQAAVVAGFGEVLRRPIAAPSITTPLLDAARAASTLVIAPVGAQTRELSIKWDLPISAGDKTDVAACAFLAYLLDSAGKGSLLAHLRALGLAEDISIFPHHFASGRTLLTVSFDVTDLGVRRRDEVLSMFFAALAQFRNLPRLRPLMREQQAQTWRQYAYQNPGPGYDAVAKTADQMLTEPLETFPDVQAQSFDLDHATWGRLLAQLNQTAAHVTLFAPPSLSGVTPAMEHTEPRMQARYAWLSGPVSQDATWVADGFGVPETNPWMPQQFAVAHADNDAPTLEHPQHLVDDAYASIFVARDRQHTSPRLSLTVDIKTPAAQPEDAASEALYDLWWQAADDALQDLRSEAETAGLHLKVTTIEGGMRLCLYGFDDKAPELLEVTLRRLTHIGTQITAARFAQLRSRLARVYNDQTAARPRDVAYAALFAWRMQRTFAVPEKRAALGALEAGDLARMAQQIFSHVYTQASFFGNVDAHTAYRCYASINRYLRHEVFSEGRQVLRRSRDMRNLARPAHLLVQTPLARGNAMLLQLCEGADTPETKAASMVLSQALEPEFFDVLRTREQTAYSLSTSGISRDGQLFRTFSVNPFHLTAQAVAKRVDVFLRSFVKELATGGISQEDFAAYKATVRKQWVAEVDQVAMGNERLHWLAFDRRGDFTLVQRRVDALDGLTYATFLRYARGALTTQHRVEVWVEGPDYLSD